MYERFISSSMLTGILEEAKSMVVDGKIGYRIRAAGGRRQAQSA
jgi:hypothetical protein